MPACAPKSSECRDLIVKQQGRDDLPFLSFYQGINIAPKDCVCTLFAIMFSSFRACYTFAFFLNVRMYQVLTGLFKTIIVIRFSVTFIPMDNDFIRA